MKAHFLQTAPASFALFLFIFLFSSVQASSVATAQEIADGKLSRSLLFDQDFDQSSYRPFPAIEAPKLQSPTLPLNVLQRRSRGTAQNTGSAYIIEQLKKKTRPPQEKTQVSSQQELRQQQQSIAAKPEAPKVEQLESRGPASAPSVVSRPFRAPTADPKLAQVIVLDDQSVSLGQPKPMGDVSIHWIAERSGMITTTDESGLSFAPYPNTHSMRFVAKAPGYLPAVGYAVLGSVSPALMVHESRVAPMVKSLDLANMINQPMVLGRILDKNYHPQSSFTVDLSSQSASGRVFYSSGPWGIFHKSSQSSGPMGDFFIAGLNRGLQYLMPTRNMATEELRSLALQPENSQSMKEWPAMIVSLDHLPDSFSITIQEGDAVDNLGTYVLDAFEMSRPNSGIHVTVGGQRGLYVPDGVEGFVQPSDLVFRNSADLIEVQAQGYRKTWISSVATRANFPEHVGLFTDRQLVEIFQKVYSEITLSKGLIIGHLRSEHFTSQLQVQIFDMSGRRVTSAKVHYFDPNSNLVDPALKSTGGPNPRFAISDLPGGEWQLLIIDKNEEFGIASQLVRTEIGTLTQVQF